MSPAGICSDNSPTGENDVIAGTKRENRVGRCSGQCYNGVVLNHKVIVSARRITGDK